jgi:hypothetical protein
MRIRYLAIFALLLLFLWLSFGAPVPVGTLEPMKADARIPTFQESLANKSELERALRDGRLVEAPRQHALRVAVLDAGDRVQAAPCDPNAREVLRASVAEFLSYQIKIQDQPPAETLAVDGRIIEARGFFNSEAASVMRSAMAAGIVPPNTPGFGGTFKNPTSGERYACNRTSQLN